MEIFSGQIQVYKDQVQQFSITIVQLEKNFGEEQEKRIKLQTDLDNLNQNGKNTHIKFIVFIFIFQVNEATLSSAAVETVVPVVPVLTAPIADLRLASIYNRFLFLIIQ